MRSAAWPPFSGRRQKRRDRQLRPGQPLGCEAWLDLTRILRSPVSIPPNRSIAWIFSVPAPGGGGWFRR